MCRARGAGGQGKPMGEGEIGLLLSCYDKDGDSHISLVLSSPSPCFSGRTKITPWPEHSLSASQ